MSENLQQRVERERDEFRAYRLWHGLQRLRLLIRDDPEVALILLAGPPEGDYSRAQGQIPVAFRDLSVTVPDLDDSVHREGGSESTAP